MFRFKSKYGNTSKFVFLSLIFVLVIVISLSKDGVFSIPKKLILDGVTHLQGASTTIGDWITSKWRHYIYLVGVSEENERLKREMAQLREDSILCEELKLENERVGRLIDFSKRMNLKIVGARVVGYNPDGNFRMVIIDKGEGDGISVNMPVISSDGLVGRVVEVGYHSAKVLLIVDRNSAVDVRDERSRIRGLLVGAEDRFIFERPLYLTRFEYLEKKSDIEEKDRLVTSGIDGIYPPGIPVGEVIEVKKDTSGIFMEAYVLPLVDFSNIEEVGVIVGH